MNKKSIFQFFKKNKNYRIYFIAQIISKCGDVLFKIALTWYILEETNSVLALSISSAVNFLPKILFFLFNGYIIDKFDRKKMMVLSDFISGLSVLLLCCWVWFSGFNLFIVFIVMFLLSFMDTLYSPSTRAFIPTIVSSEDLLFANTIYNGLSELVNIGGIALAGIMLLSLDIKYIFVINMMTYFFAAFMINIIQSSISKSSVSKKFNQNDLFAGFQYIKKDSFTKMFMIMVTISNIAYSVIYLLPSVYSKNILNAGSSGYSAIEISVSFGMMLSLWLISKMDIKKVGKIFILGNFIGGLLILILYFGNSMGLTLLIYFLFGIADGITLPCFTYLQLHIPDEIKGRVYALLDAVLLCAGPIGSVITGFVAERSGIKILFMLSSLSLLLSVVIGLNSKTFFKSDLSKIDR